MNSVKYMILYNWHLMRIVRLAIGIWLLLVAIQSHDWIPGVVSALFLFQAITNTGCCGNNGICYQPGIKQQHNVDDIPEAGYEEIK